MLYNYRHIYSHLLGDISSHDFDLLQEAEYAQCEEIDPSKAIDQRVRHALNKIQSVKHHQQEAALGYI